MENAPTTTAALRVADAAEKQPVDPDRPDWDVQAVPVKVTPAMAAAFRSMTEEMKLDYHPLLWIGFRNGAKVADVVPECDPQTELTFAFNGVVVVVRKDQVERLRGGVVDYQSSAFATGVVIRLPGE